MLTLNVKDLTTPELQSYLHYTVAPRPICFASTIDKNGSINLSPFSFFNVFSINPPICVFSPTSRARDNTSKHTVENVLEVPECVINIVNYDMVQQTYLASADYPKGVNEFIKAGFTELPSSLVKPPRVAQSPVQMECIVNDVISLGKNGGAGNLVIAEVKLIHINEDILDDNGKIDPHKIDLVARLGGDWYCRITDNNLFKINKPATNAGVGMGIDALPQSIRNSTVLTGNDLGQLGNLTSLPTDDAVKAYRDKNMEKIPVLVDKLHFAAQDMLNTGNLNEAILLLLAQEK